MKKWYKKNVKQSWKYYAEVLFLCLFDLLLLKVLQTGSSKFILGNIIAKFYLSYLFAFWFWKLWSLEDNHIILDKKTLLQSDLYNI